jgi:hypothetical protein
MDLNKKLEDILHIIKDISVEDEMVGAVLFEGFGISLNTLQQIAKNETRQRPEIDLGEQIDMISDALNFSLEDIVMGIIELKNQDTINNNKEADEETLDFITANADIDDYDTFLKDNNITETLEELKKEV